MYRRLGSALAMILVSVGLLLSGCLGPGPSNQPPVASFTSSRSEALVGDIIGFDASASSDDRGIARYHFEFGDSDSKDGMVVTHAYSAAGRYRVRLSVTDSDGLVSTAERDVTINDPPAKNIGLACAKFNTTSYTCNVAAADAGVDFSKVGAELRKESGEVVSRFSAPLPPSVQNDSASPPVFIGRLADNGDGAFGVGDDFYFVPYSGQSLAGLTLRLEGGGALGQFRIP